VKKLLLVLPLLGVAGWAGATMYAGQETQSAYDQLLNQLRVQHGLQVEPMEYEKNFLSSRIKTIVNKSNGQYDSVDDLPEPLRSLSSSFVLVHDIEHGPVVLSNGLKALAGRIKTTVDMDSLDPEFAQAWKQGCACEEPVVLQSEITLQGEYSHVFDVASIDWSDGDSHVSFGGIHSESRVDTDSRATSVGQTGVLSMQFDGSHINVAAGQWQLLGREAIKNIIVGDATFTLPSINIDNAGKNTALSEVKVELKSDLSNGNINSYADFSAGTLSTPMASFNDTHLDLEVNGISAETFTESMEGLSHLNRDIDQHAVELLEIYHNFIQPGLELKYGLRGENANGGAFDAGIALSYAPEAGISFDNMQTVGDLLTAIEAKASVKLDDTLLSQLPGDADQNPMLHSIFNRTSDGYSLNAHLLDGSAELNGNPFPLTMMFAEQLAQPLPTIEQIALAMKTQ